MKILEKASKDQVIQAIKAYEELTKVEKQAIKLEDGKLTDYFEFRVRYSEYGSLERVLAYNWLPKSERTAI